MLLGLTLGALSVVILALATTPALLVTMAFLGGATQQAYFPSSNAAIADVVPPEDRQRAYGHVYWAANLGLALGFAVAGLVATAHLPLLFLADAGTSLLCAALVLWKVPETRPAFASESPGLLGLFGVLQDRVFFGFCALHTVALLVFTQFQLALPLEMAAHAVGSQGFSQLMAINCLGVVLLQPWMTPLLRRFDPSRLLALSSLLVGTGYVINTWVSTLSGYLFGSAFWTVGEVVGFPAASALVANLAPVPLRGRYQGMFSMVWGLSMTLSPIVGGQLMHRLGSPALWAACFVASALVATGHLLSARARRRAVELRLRGG